MKQLMKPVHPGAILREDILKELNLTVTKAAQQLQISRKQLSAIVNESASITAEMAVRLENGFGLEANLWLDLQNNYDLWDIKESGKFAGVKRISPVAA